MTDTALEPKLDPISLEVLRAIPACGKDEWRERGIHETLTLWQIGEAVRSTDLADVLLTLNGLVHLDYAFQSRSAIRMMTVYFRTQKGDGAVR